MTATKKGFHYPSDISLKTSPLVEAWLTIQWQLEEIQAEPLVARDPGFDFAFVLRFFESVKSRYKNLVELDIKTIPIEITPHQPRYQFRTSEEHKWPVIQLGPGIATVNFTEPYTWSLFEKEALFLQRQLVSAYSAGNFVTRLVSLRYRNAVPCKYTSQNLLQFLESELNTCVKPPVHIPGPTVAGGKASEINLSLTYNLERPKARGVLRIVSGTKKVTDKISRNTTDEEHIVFEQEIVTFGTDAPSLSSRPLFKKWLNSAHDVTHEWFFSLIDGALLKQYKGIED